MPVVTLVISFESLSEPRPVTRLVIKTSELEELYEWSQIALIYIRKNTDRGNLDLSLALRRYQELLDSFYNWCFEELTTTWKDLIDDFTSRQEELARLTSGKKT
jgi:hypothetical protein